MAEGIDNISSQLVEGYEAFVSSLYPWMQNFLELFLLVVLITAYSVFIWKFYRFVSHKNIFELNLSKYNKSEHPFFAKVLASVFYLLEYIVILPFLIFFWFAVFTLFLIFLTEGLEVKAILIISVGIIGAIRMTSYLPRYGADLSKDLAKLLPFTLLAISITKPGFFDFQRILGDMTKIPEFINDIFIYLAFIVFLEIVLRLFDFVFTLLDLQEPNGEEEED